MKYNNNIYIDSIGWDTVNWAKGLKFVEKLIDFKDKKVLELGCGCQNGGLSLWAASLGAKEILCTNYGSVSDITKKIHKFHKYNNIEYKNIDALKIPYIKEFDIIIFKSMMGGIARNNFDYTKLVLTNCAQALKPNGFLFFSENLTSSFLHMLCRRKLKKMTWHYYELDELKKEIEKVYNFKVVDHKEYGVVACFGFTEKQKIILGKLDNMLEKLCPQKWRYITSWVLQKKEIVL